MKRQEKDTRDRAMKEDLQKNLAGKKIKEIDRKVNGTVKVLYFDDSFILTTAERWNEIEPFVLALQNLERTDFVLADKKQKGKR